ncbi:MAG: alpha-amylase family glycosyl hydrolase, partial [Limisphaerales bacterium]
AADGPRKVWTTFSADQVDLDVRQPAVLLALIEAMLAYVANGARYLRLDAIAFLWKEIGTSCLHHPQTHRVIQLMRAVLDEVAPDVMLITETNVPHVDNVSYFGDGTNEAQLVYNFALPPLVLHSLQTGNAARLTRWAASLTLPSDQVTFFNFLASHDGIGLNPARGILADAEIEAMVARTIERGGFISNKSLPDGSEIPYEMNINYLDALSDPSRNEPAALITRRFLTAQAIMLSLQGVPGIYFHSLFGSRGDRAGAEASGIKRRINRQKLDRTQLEAELTVTPSLRHEVFSGYRRLLARRAAHAAFAPSASQQILEIDDRVFAVRRASPETGDQALCLHNVSGDTIRCELPPFAGVDRWHDLDDHAATGPAEVQLDPWASRWLGA